MLFPLGAMAHEGEGHGMLKYEENKGQWPARVNYRVRVPNGSVFLEGQCLTFLLENPEENLYMSQIHHGMAGEMPDTLHYHAFRLHLAGSKTPSAVTHHEELPDHVNYYLGNDPSKWASGVKQYREVVYRDIYPGIDVRFYSENHDFKYDFIVHPGADPSQIRLEYEGVDGVKPGLENLLIETSVQNIVDRKPVSWSLAGEHRDFVRSAFRLQNNPGANPLVQFDLAPYDSSSVLIIDPTLIFSSYTGSSANNWGSTATYDSLGNMYVGGTVIVGGGSGTANGYPTSTGAIQAAFAGGTGTIQCDMAISKFNAAGSNLLYSTYLGGSSNEIPHSLVVNDNNELYILGTTSSNDFPVTGSAFDGTFNGGTNIIGSATVTNSQANSNSIPYTNGSDIVVAKLNTSATALLGSTYIGGTANDGINLSDTLQRAYADEFRGEIIVDANDNCYVATSSGSANFPIVNGFQATYGGGLTDGVVFKLNSNLSALLWSTFIGGSDADAAYSVQFDPNFDVFATGGTKSNDFPTTAGVIHPNYMGGTTDGWVAKISNNGQTLLASTFLGTSNYDQSFFVQLDLQGFVYTVGHSLGNYPITPAGGVYSVANSGQFLHKLSNNLQSTVFSTRWGSGNGNINLSLTAFLVNQCNHIFISGWGGTLFAIGGQTSTASTTNGLPVTANAVQTTTDGNDFYFLVLEDNATGVLFGSYFGGNSANSGQEHADGGTSRFDKKGIIYQAVCASCATNNTFPTTTGAYATSKGGNATCNLAAIKYDLVTLIAEADVDGPPEVCVKDSIQFKNESFGGSLFYWDFGDGNVSNDYEPKHAYSTPGQFEVMLVIYDSVSCIFADTDFITLVVIPGPEAVVPNVPRVCPGKPVQLNASGGSSYYWVPAAGLSDDSIANPIATVTENTAYTVVVSDSCGVDSGRVTVHVHDDYTSAIPDTALCGGLSGQLWARGGVSYQWSPGLFLSFTNVARPWCTPDTSIHYTVTIIDSFQCEREHEVAVYVEGFVPQVEAWGDTVICQGDRVLLTATGAPNYQWSPSTWVLDPNLSSTPAYPEETTVYTVRTFNSCGEAFDSVRIEVNPIEVDAWADTAVCLGDSIRLGATGALLYKWTGQAMEVPNYNQFPEVYPTESSWYVVTGSNITGCAKKDSLYVTVFPMPELEILSSAEDFNGLENMVLCAQSSGDIRWISEGYVPCATCDTIVVYPLLETKYFVEATDSNLCVVRDSITVKAISKIFTPNSFTPNGDKVNDLFYVQGHNIVDYEIYIRDRWGLEVYYSNDMAKGWNGKKYNSGKDLPIGVYHYYIKYRVLPEEELYHIGSVTLLR